ncbi:MAG: NADH-quinone oxidoreductase subunit G [Betaproteobacteria bacterium]|nr:NADH-quinone oxidoreductase subunit G [Betaproteobacteria bacterium]
MINLEVDGRAVQVPEGSMVMEATNRLGIYVPHFCWHRKLSIAANCRMCLVQVEKAPKPLPACATPATEGMKVFTHSDLAVQAQKGVMEFLLINHPLDCPICDQGGECQLQDLAVGYGGAASRYGEQKRVVPRKDVGPLVAAEEMTRCIHCTRCVRFGQEIAGIMELGMAGRGEHSEILSFVGRTVDSELSGNMIDLCPVGALTSKPFRYTARTWELARRRTVSPHCGLGANMVVQVKGNRVMRALPLDNEAVNECWLSDKDRFSYEGLNSSDRLVRPMIRKDGKWHEVDWQSALEITAEGIRKVLSSQGGAQALGLLASPHGTLEELHLAGKLVRGLGSDNVDFRLRRSDFSLDRARRGIPWLGASVAALSGFSRVCVVGSNLRKDHPLLAARMRVAARKGMRLAMMGSFFHDPLIPLVTSARVAPAALPRLLAETVVECARLRNTEVAAALRQVTGSSVPGEQAKAFARFLAAEDGSGLILLGNEAEHHPQAGLVEVLVRELCRLTGSGSGFLGEAANSVGGYVAKATPQADGLDASRMISEPRKGYVLLGCEPELDCADGAAALAAMHAADFVVALSPFTHRAAEYANVLLPMAPFTETGGTFVNTEGRVQSFQGVVQPLGEARPGWKVLRVLGNLLGVPGFDFDSVEDVRKAALGDADTLQSLLDNGLGDVQVPPLPAAVPGLQRVGDVPIHFADPLVRRAPSLQRTRDAEPPQASMNARTLVELAVADGDQVRVTQGDASVMLFAALDDRVPDHCVRIAAGHPFSAGLGPLMGDVHIERVAATSRASA